MEIPPNGGIFRFMDYGLWIFLLSFDIQLSEIIIYE